MCIYIYTYTIHIYIYVFNTHIYIYIYTIYIYIPYTYTHVFIHISYTYDINSYDPIVYIYIYISTPFFRNHHQSSIVWWYTSQRSCSPRFLIVKSPSIPNSCHLSFPARPNLEVITTFPWLIHVKSSEDSSNVGAPKLW